MLKDFELEPLVIKIKHMVLQAGSNGPVSVVLASKGIDDEEAASIERWLLEALNRDGLDVSLQWIYSETAIRCGLCHSVFKLKKMNRETVLCPICEFKSVELLSEKSLSLFSVIG